jgi:hypothetical protein
MSLFTEDTHFVVFMDAKSSQPAMDLHRREDLAPVFADLNKYEATTHFLGQSTIVLDKDQAGRNVLSRSSCFCIGRKTINLRSFAPLLRCFCQSRWAVAVRRAEAHCGLDGDPANR